ncbi:MAG: HAD-IA family hydrolase [Acidobacteriota bacterium]|nr:HAD-IA family hydrolase [Acidobacteriota bacterium]
MTITTQGLLFDMDGVLVSSIGSVNRCWHRWCTLNHVPDPAAFEVPHGTRALDIIRILKPEWNDAEVQAGLRQIEDLEIADVADLRVLPGVKALLSALPPERWAIVTSATHRLLTARLKAAGLPIPERLITGEMVTRGKPDPEPYRRGAELLGLTPADCIVVEDAPSGVGAGIAAGSRVLAVLTTHSPSELSAATWRLGSLADLHVTQTPAGLVLQPSSL